LEKQVRQLIDESVALLRLRMTELGIETDTPDDLMAKARELSVLHRDLTLRSVELQHHVQYLEREGQNLMTWMQKNQDPAGSNGINKKPVNGVRVLSKV
jgi:H3 lysine-79-specific histone-lysine N-methyltransferase